MFLRRFSILFLIVSLLLCPSPVFSAEAEKLDPDKLQLLLDLTGEGADQELVRELELAVQTAWAENSPYQRYMFISAALDTLGALEKFSDQAAVTEKIKLLIAANSEHAQGAITNPSKLQNASEVDEGKKAAASFASAEVLIADFSSKELRLIKKQFRPGELELLEEDNPWKKLELKEEKLQLTAILAGIFMHGIIGVKPMRCSPENLKGFDKLPLEFTREDYTRAIWKRHFLSIAKERTLAIFEHWLPFTEEHAVVLEGLGDEKEGKLLAVKKDIESRSKKAVGDLAVSIPKELIKQEWSFMANLPDWMKKAAESPYSVHLTRQIFKTGTTEANLSNSATSMLKTRLKDKKGIDTALPASSLKSQFTELFGNWKNEGFKKMKIRGGPVQLGTAFKAVGYGAVIAAAVDLSCKMGGALLKGQQDEELKVADRQVSYTPRNKQMQRSTDKSLDKKRDKKYAFEDAWADYKENIISNSAGIITATAVGVAGTAMVMGAAAAAGLPTAGVGGAVVGAAGFVVVGTASGAASKGVKKIISPLEDKVNDFIAKGQIKEALAHIMSDMDYDGDKKEIRKKLASAMEERYRAGRPHRFMALINSFENIELEREKNGLVHFTMEHKNGNLLADVKKRASLAGTVKKIFRRKTTKEAHVRYEYFDIEENLAFWDGYSNRIIPCGSHSLNTNDLVFVGTDSQNIIYKGNKIKGIDPKNDLRVLSNGILMVRNEFTDEWEVRGKVFQNDIYLRSGKKPGRYTWNEKEKAYHLIFAGEKLSRDRGLDKEGRGIAVDDEKKGSSGRTKVRKYHRIYTGNIEGKGNSSSGKGPRKSPDKRDLPSFDGFEH